MQHLGVPYPENYDLQALVDMDKQANEIVADLKTQGINAKPQSEMIALIAYLQRLGTDIKEKSQTAQH